MFIFEDETHPSMHSSIRGRKEGLSLYGVMNYTKTPQGRYLLKQWLLRPSLDVAIIHARQQTIECFIRAENQSTVGQLSESLSHIRNVPKVLRALPRKATLAEWQIILQFVYYCLKINNVSQEIFVGEAPVITDVLQNFVVQDLMDVGANINDVVDFDESVIEGRCVVKHNVDEELDEMRKIYHGLDSFLSEIAKEISQNIPSNFASIINVIYFPQLGYLITVPRNPSWKTEEDFFLEGLHYQFSTESTVYFKNTVMRGILCYPVPLSGPESSYREIDIMQGLQGKILEYSSFLVTCSDICAELDVLVSLSQVARLRNYRRPRITEQNILHIVNGRHPLQELVVNSFVSNNTLLGDTCDYSSNSAVEGSSIATTGGDRQRSVTTDTGTEAHTQPQSECRNQYESHENRIMILSGANSSGKSIYLKQVALITFMAHIGSFVPAESAVIGLTDKILTRVQTLETVSNIQSAFMTDLQQVTLALRMATKRSLIVIDEFGKGTTATDGAGLFCGLIEHFANLPASDRPKVLATTHFHELLENKLLNLELPIALHTMEVYQEPNGLEATFLFRVIKGSTPSSLGPACAAMASMPPKIVERGVELSRLFRRYEMVIPRLTRRDQKMQRMYERLVRKLVRLDLDQTIEYGEDRNRNSMQQSGERGGVEEQFPAISASSSSFSELFELFAEDARRLEMEMEMEKGIESGVNTVADAIYFAKDEDITGAVGKPENKQVQDKSNLDTKTVLGKRAQFSRDFSEDIERLLEYAEDVDFEEHVEEDEDEDEDWEEENKSKDCKADESVDPLEGYADLDGLDEECVEIPRPDGQ
ncbi:MutS protein msh5 [Mortierella sp. GBA30]|nr:MutS protein msh5 [Mortierella sp. GBA30]